MGRAKRVPLKRMTEEQKRLAEQWHPMAVAFVRRMSLNPATAGIVDELGFAELLSISYMGLIEATQGWRHDGGAKFNTYAWNAMRMKFFNAIRVHFRERKIRGNADFNELARYVTHGVGVPGERSQQCNPVDEAEDNERDSIVREILEKLPEENRYAIEQYYFRGWTDREIGAARGITKQGANVWRAEGLRMMHWRLAQRAEELAEA